LSDLIPEVPEQTMFDVYDLFEDEGEISEFCRLGKISPNQNLNLRVNPQGVRMVKLVPK